MRTMWTYIFIAAASSVAAEGNTINYPIETYIRMRCSTNASHETILSWSGQAYSMVPQEEQRELFGLFGINLARCWFNTTTNTWKFSSRELQYYLDPATQLPIYTYDNPWTGEKGQNVVHVANDPVQFDVGDDSMQFEYQPEADQVVLPENVNLFYPNPLYMNETYRPYAWQKMYEGSELFNFFAPKSEMDSKLSSEVSGMHFSWTRISQWVPFMKMGPTSSNPNGYPGSMLFTATGGRTTFEELPGWLQDDITMRVPLYRHPPRCMLALNDSTSWTYFGDNFAKYLNGDQFPVPTNGQPLPPCATAPAV